LQAAQSAVEPPPQEAARIKEAEVHLGLWMERGLMALDGYASMEGARSVTMLAQAPLDLVKVLREPGYLAKAVDRPLRATVTASQIDLQQLAELGLAPEGTAGKITGSVELDGTLAAPLL